MRFSFVCVAVRCSALQGVAVRCSALQCVAVRCSALQRVAVFGIELQLPIDLTFENLYLRIRTVMHATAVILKSQLATQFLVHSVYKCIF